MKTPLRTLIVEDNEDDALLIARELQKAGYATEHTRVDSAKALRAALADGGWDIVVSDYRMPGFTGLDALELVRETGMDVPFILVSGTIGEDVAVAAMKAGAHDYLMKDRLARLGAAVERELGEAENRRARRQAEEETRQKTEDLRFLHDINQAANRGASLSEIAVMISQRVRNTFGALGAVLYTLTPDGRAMVSVNQPLPEARIALIEQLLGRPIPPVRFSLESAGVYSRSLQTDNPQLFQGSQEVRKLIDGMAEGINPALRRVYKGMIPAIQRALGIQAVALIPLRSEGKAIGMLEASHGESFTAEATHRLAHVADLLTSIITRKLGEEVLRQSEERYRALVEASPDAIVLFDLDLNLSMANPQGLRMLGYERAADVVGRNMLDFLAPGQETYLRGQVERLLRESVINGIEFGMIRKDGTTIPVETSASTISDAQGNPGGMVVVGRDITERKQAEEALRHRVTELAGLHATMLEISVVRESPMLLRAIVERATRLLGAETGGLYLCDPERQQVRCVVSYNTPRDYTGVVLAYGEGAAGTVAQTGKALVIDDYRLWSGRAGVYEEDQPFHALLSVPLIWQDRVIGVLHAERNQRNGLFTHAEEGLLSLFAQQAAVAIVTTQLYEETSRRAAYLEALTGTAESLRAAVTPEEMYREVLDRVVQQLRAEGATLTLLDPESGETEAILGVGAWHATTGMRLPRGEGIVGMVTSNGQTFVSDDVHGDPRLACPDLLMDTPAVACVPLTVEDRTIGCVMVGRQAPLSVEEVRLLTGLAEIAGNAIYRAQVMATLEARVRQRTQELEAANERLLELDRLKTEFVSNVTHELRTPITNVLLYLDLARRTSSEPKRGHYFDVLKSESVRLGTLIESVLTLSRLERGMVPMSLEPHPLDALLADVLVGHQARAEAKGIVLDHEPDVSLPVAWVNRVQMHQVLANLVGNAVAYTPPGGHVNLGTARTQVGGQDYVGAVVHNSGTVISPEDIKHMFQRFYRGAVGRESGEPGTGLGLAISKEIVELHHGWIDVESSQQAGTTFTVWLPQVDAT